MNVSLCNHITKLNILPYKNQRVSITKKLISTEPHNILHLTFFKNLQIILTNLPNCINKFIKNLSIANEGEYKYCFNNIMFDNYFFYKIKPYIKICCRRILQNNYFVKTLINNFKFISTLLN